MMSKANDEKGAKGPCSRSRNVGADTDLAHHPVDGVRDGKEPKTSNSQTTCQRISPAHGVLGTLGVIRLWQRQ